MISLYGMGPKAIEKLRECKVAPVSHKDPCHGGCRFTTLIKYKFVISDDNNAYKITRAGINYLENR